LFLLYRVFVHTQHLVWNVDSIIFFFVLLLLLLFSAELRWALHVDHLKTLLSWFDQLESWCKNNELLQQQKTTLPKVGRKLDVTISVAFRCCHSWMRGWSQMEIHCQHFSLPPSRAEMPSNEWDEKTIENWWALTLWHKIETTNFLQGVSFLLIRDWCTLIIHGHNFKLNAFPRWRNMKEYCGKFRIFNGNCFSTWHMDLVTQANETIIATEQGCSAGLQYKKSFLCVSPTKSVVEDPKHFGTILNNWMQRRNYKASQTNTVLLRFF